MSNLDSLLQRMAVCFGLAVMAVGGPNPLLAQTPGDPTTITPVFNSLVSGQESYLRIFNPTSTPADYVVRVYRSRTGDYIGEATLTVLDFMSRQLAMSELEALTTPEIVPEEPGTYSLQIEALDGSAGHAQHVVWNSDGGSLTNLSTCGSDRFPTRYLTNIHTSEVQGFPGSITFQNEGAIGRRPVLSMSGSQHDVNPINTRVFANWFGPVIPAQSSMTVPVQQIFEEVRFTPSESQFHVHFALRHSEFVGFAAHVVDNQQGGVLTSMTESCVVRPATLESNAAVSSVPEHLNEKGFYGHYLDAGGISILASSKVDPSALTISAPVIEYMLSHRPEFKAELVNRKFYIALLAESEYVTELPGKERLKRVTIGSFREFEGLRGLGAGLDSQNRPYVVVGEERLLRKMSDAADDESRLLVLVHELAHAIQSPAISTRDRDLYDRIGDAYESAVAEGLWTSAYIGSNEFEYFAEGAVSWFNLHPALKGTINTREELQEHDPALHDLLSEVFPAAYLPDTPRYLNPSEVESSSAASREGQSSTKVLSNSDTERIINYQ